MATEVPWGWSKRSIAPLSQAMAELPKAAMLTNWLTVPSVKDSRAGVERLAVKPSPTWPRSPWPQPKTRPSEVSAKEELACAAIATTEPEIPLTCTGLLLFADEPFPCWPKLP